MTAGAREWCPAGSTHAAGGHETRDDEKAGAQYCVAENKEVVKDARGARARRRSALRGRALVAAGSKLGVLQTFLFL